MLIPPSSYSMPFPDSEKVITSRNIIVQDSEVVGVRTGEMKPGSPSAYSSQYERQLSSMAAS